MYKILTVRNFKRKKFVWTRINIDNKFKGNKIMSNKETHYNYACFAIFTSLIIAALVVFSKAMNVDSNYICYLTIGAIIVNAIATYFVFNQIKSPEEIELELERRDREKDSLEHSHREEIESVWRTIDNIESKVDKLCEELNKSNKKK